MFTNLVVITFPRLPKGGWDGDPWRVNLVTHQAEKTELCMTSLYTLGDWEAEGRIEVILTWELKNVVLADFNKKGNLFLLLYQQTIAGLT